MAFFSLINDFQESLLEETLIKEPTMVEESKVHVPAAQKPLEEEPYVPKLVNLDSLDEKINKVKK